MKVRPPGQFWYQGLAGQIFLLLSACVFGIACRSLQPRSDPYRTLGVANPFRWKLNYEENKLPDSDLRSYAAYVSCAIDQQDGECLFDTGAIGVTLNNCFADDARGGRRATGIFGLSGNEVAVSERMITSLRIGTSPYEPVAAAVSPGRPCDRDLAIVGIDALGAEFYLDLVSWTVGSGTAGVPWLGTLSRPGGLLAIEVEFLGEVRRALVDTGAMTTLVDASLVSPGDLANLSPVNGGEYGIVDAYGDVVTLREIFKASIKIGGTERKALTLATMDLDSISQSLGQHIDMVLGLNALRGLKLAFNLFENRWGLAARPEVTTKPD